MTATRGLRAGWAMTALRRAIGTLRSVNDENVRASEAIVRSARAPQPRPQAGASADCAPAHAAAAAERTVQAA